MSLPRVLPRGPNAARKHEVEQLGLANFIVGIWISQVVVPAQLANFSAGVIVQLRAAA